MDVAMAGLNPSTWRLTFIQRDVVILESSAAETTTIQGTITSMVVDTEPPQCRRLRTRSYLKVMLPKTQRREKARIDQADHWERRCGKEKTNNCFYNDDLILNININYVEPGLPLSISSSYSQWAGPMTSLREAPKRQF